MRKWSGPAVTVCNSASWPESNIKWDICCVRSIWFGTPASESHVHGTPLTSIFRSWLANTTDGYNSTMLCVIDPPLNPSPHLHRTNQSIIQIVFSHFDVEHERKETRPLGKIVATLLKAILATPFNTHFPDEFSTPVSINLLHATPHRCIGLLWKMRK